jgi:uncharacterized protein (TIGR02001 family)
MKKASLVIALLALATLAPEARAEEAEKAWSLDTTVGFFSDYMFRGTNLYDGSSIQPATTFSYDTGAGVISANLWMHLSGEGDRQDSKFTELDGMVSYAIDLKPVSLKVGHYWYTYPDSSDTINDTAEFFAGVAFDDSECNSFFTLSPSLTVYQDYRDFDSQYYELGFSHAVETDSLGKGFTATPYVTFGFGTNAEKIYADEQGLMQVTYGVSTELPLGDFTVVPSVNYTHKVDDATVNELWFGGNLNYSF